MSDLPLPTAPLAELVSFHLGRGDRDGLSAAILRACGPDVPEIVAAQVDALAALATGDPDAAMRLALAGLRSKPDEPLLWYLFGHAAAQLGEAAGVGVAARAIRQHGGPASWAEAFELRAAALAGDAAGVVARATQLLAERPDDPELLDALVWAQVAQGQGAIAVATARRLTGLRPDSAGSWALLAATLAVERDFAAAARAQREAAVRAPRSLAVGQALATFQLAAGQAGDAAATVALHLEANAGSAALWTLGAQAAQALGQHDLAAGLAAELASLQAGTGPSPATAAAQGRALRAAATQSARSSR